MTTFGDAARSSGKSKRQTPNEEHTCANCGAIDWNVGRNRPFCPPCWKRARQAETAAEEAQQ